MMSASIEGVTDAPAGRRVGFAVYGDPDGRPVVFCHGGPGSRRSVLGSPATLATAGLRLVCVDRPGAGWSDLRAGWGLLDWPEDVDVVVSALGIDRYAVAGVSAGSRYALACGVRRPEAVDEVAVIAGVLPPSWYPDDELVALAARDVDAARQVIRDYVEGLAADVDAAVEAMGKRPGPDGVVYRRPEVKEQFLATYREAFRSGVDGAVHDVLLGNLPWGFDLADVTVPVHWWQGVLDHLTPASTVQRAIDGLSNYALIAFEDEGHGIGIAHAEDIIRFLAVDTQ
jgi:pimeloyl-ACP methyl ester carboxylesterase